MEPSRPEPGSQTSAGNTSGIPERTGPTVLEIWSPTCTECRAMRSDLDSVAADYSDRVGLELVNAIDELQTVWSLGVKGTPTLIGLRGDEEVFRVVGRRSRSELEALFHAVAVGENAPAEGYGDLWLRLGAGVVLVGVGLFSGPSWALVAFGLAAVTLGVISWLRK